MQRTKKLEEINIKTRQEINKGTSKRCCRRQSTWHIIAPLLHRYRSAVAPLSHHCCTAVAHYRHAVSPLSLRCCTATAPLSFRCRSAAVAPLSRRCRTAIAPFSHRCCRSCCLYAVAPVHTAIAPLSLRCRCCCYILAPLSHRYRSTVATLPVLSLLLSQRYHFCYCSCCDSRPSPHKAESG